MVHKERDDVGLVLRRMIESRGASISAEPPRSEILCGGLRWSMCAGKGRAPLPLGPTRATVEPAATVKLTPSRVHALRPACRKRTSRNSMSPRTCAAFSSDDCHPDTAPSFRCCLCGALRAGTRASAATAEPPSWHGRTCLHFLSQHDHSAACCTKQSNFSDRLLPGVGCPSLARQLAHQRRCRSAGG